MEWNDVYDAHRKPLGRAHRRDTPWNPGEYGLAVCVWVVDGHGRVLLTRRAPGKSFAGTWENSGGAAKAGETSLQAVVRELYEETGIHAQPDEFRYLCSSRDDCWHYDHYCLKNATPLAEIVLQPGETDAAQWVTFHQVHQLIDRGEICSIIAQQFLRQEPMLRSCQAAQE